MIGTLLGIENQTLVQITVRDRTLAIYPQRARDTVVFHVGDPIKSNPARPHGVRWVVTGLGEHQRVEISGKPSQTSRLPETGSPIVFQGPGTVTESSGEPPLGPGHGHEWCWEYDVRLFEDGIEVDHIDPTIVIKEDP